MDISGAAVSLVAVVVLVVGFVALSVDEVSVKGIHPGRSCHLPLEI